LFRQEQIATLGKKEKKEVELALATAESEYLRRYVSYSASSYLGKRCIFYVLMFHPRYPEHLSHLSSIIFDANPMTGRGAK